MLKLKCQRKEHIPVLSAELIRYLNPKPGQSLVDATAGLGGHLKQVLKNTAPNGKVLAIDYDPAAVEHLRKTIREKRLTIYHGNFKNLKDIIADTVFKRISGIYFDLGLGSWQIQNERYGLSFEKDAPLWMKISESTAPSAEIIINQWPKQRLTEILRKYGDVQRAHQIAQKIDKQRSQKPIKTTRELVEATGVKNKKVLAKIFQAIRIAVNDELESLRQALAEALDLVEKKGKIAVISYHSGEDRIVKRFFQKQSRAGKLKIITKKPVTATQKEVRQNPKARSAKMRLAEKI